MTKRIGIVGAGDFVSGFIPGGHDIDVTIISDCTAA
jgi:hypothetical protein